jgi:oligopeptidase B
MEVPANSTDWKNRKEVIAHNPSVKIEYFDEFKDYLNIIIIRESGLRKIKVYKLADKSAEYISMPDPAYTLGMRFNPNFDDTKMQYVYNSMTRPSTTYEYDMATKEQTILKQAELGVPYNPDDYQSERIFATAADGIQIPISIVYKKGLVKNGHNPTLLHGYGSYDASMDASFSGNRLSLLNRGFVYAIAHIRGGSDMGEQWYLDGKLMKKKNTFTDFIACVEKLIEDKYTTPGHLGAMGAITNMRPDLFKAVIADVPFVDVMNTILDPTLPITVGEYEEWGNPTEDKEAYEYMKSYSPYDNVTPREYPNILAIAGFNDPRVSYWESAKWVQKIRENNLGNSVVILFTNMGTGHGGASGRHDYLKEIVLDYAFLVDQLATHNH